MLRDAAIRLRAAGLPDAMADVRLFAMAAAGLRREDLLRDPDRPLDAAALARFAEMVDRRAAREPVSRIFGRREFRSLEFRLAPSTLDPRPDSETLVEQALALRGSGAIRILDIGTGTGCLLLSLLAALPDATGLGTDIAPDAVRTAAENGAALGMAGRAAFAVANWTDGIGGSFDLIVSNPPYIASGEIGALDPDVALYDPRAALDGGPDGLSAYRALAMRLGGLLAPGGVAVLEIGATQEASVAGLFGDAGYRFLGARQDLAGRPRSLAFAAGTVTNPLTVA